MTPTVDELAAGTERAFALLGEKEFPVVSRELLWPESFKGGFIITFGHGAGQVTVRYLDLEFEVRSGGRELFGPHRHPTFSGNLFSHERLAEHLERLARVAQQELG